MKAISLTESEVVYITKKLLLSRFNQHDCSMTNQIIKKLEALRGIRVMMYEGHERRKAPERRTAA